ncbi:tetratricopeptide repeat protein [Azospirillum sp. sgz302134]
MDISLDAAIRHHQAGRHSDAEPIYRAILEREPDNRNALQMFAMLLVQTGRADQAVEPFRTVTRLAPDGVAGYSNLAAALRTAGRGAEAVGSLHRALALDPAHAGSWFNLGNALKQLDKPAAAARGYGRALTLDPNHGGAATNLSALRGQWGDRLDEAARRLAASRSPAADAAAHAAAANALYAVKDPAAAEASARAALERDLHNAPANRLLGRLLLERSGAMGVADGKPFAVDGALAEEAIAALRRAVAARPDDEESEWLHVAAVMTLVQVGLATADLLHEGARAAWRRLRRHPKDVVSACVVGFHLYRSDRLDIASWLLQRFRRRFTAEEVAREHEFGIWTMLRADDAFFRSLPPVEAVLERLAPLEVVFDPARKGGTEPAVYFCCDDVYYRRFAPTLLDSLAQRMPGATVVVHVVAPTPETVQDMERRRSDGRLDLGFSRDDPEMGGWPDIKRFSYYASSRFIRTLQWLRRLDRPVIVVDTDAQVVADLRTLQAEMDGNDVGLLFDPRRRGPAREITVCFNYYKNTAGGDRYLALVAAYIGHFLAQPEVYWLLDQMAHYAVFDWMNRYEPIRVHRYDFLNFPYCHFVGAK